MVLINLKSSLPTGPITANDSFLYETTVATPNDELIASLVDIHNARVRSNLLVDGVRGLAAYGVMKKPEEVGTDEVSVDGDAAFLCLIVLQRVLLFEIVDAISCHRGSLFYCILQVQELVGKVVEKGPNYVADPSGLRTGNPPDEKMAQVLQEVALKLEEYVSKVSVDT
jgi:hypothetical protein